MVRRAFSVLAALTLVGLAGVQAGCAHGPRGDTTAHVVAESTEWDLWVDDPSDESERLVRCSSPCSLLGPGGEVTITASEPGAPEPQHAERVAAEDGVQLRVGRWSHRGERIAGGVLLALGISTVVVTPIALTVHFSTTPCLGWCFTPGLLAIMAGQYYGLPALVMVSVGIGLLAWNDTLTITDPSQDAAVTLLPTVAPTEGGATIGVAGSF
jgi:hypothetical protein